MPEQTVPELTSAPCWHGDSRSCRCEDRDDASELARALAARRQRTVIRCEVCGQEAEVWQRKRQQARTCSNRCRQALHRRRKKEEQR